MESLCEAELESLRGFLSESLFQCLTTDTESTATPHPVDLPTPSSSTQATFTDAELFLACSTSFEQQPLQQPIKRQRLCAAEGCTSTARIFAPPKTEQDIQQARLGAIPKKTQSDTKYCIGMWNEWRYHRYMNYHDSIPEITVISWPELATLLSKFVLEVRKKNGDEFPPNTLLHIVSGLQRYLRLNGQPEIDFFKLPDFAGFRADLDAEMKRLQRSGLGSKRRQAEPLTIDEEELLWTKGLLGSNSPQTLVDTIFFMNGIYFALRSGAEHRQLRHDPCQIELFERSGERSYLKYTEDLSKNKPGGLKGRKMKPKVVLHHANEKDPGRCFVHLFKMYRRLCPKDQPKDAFYLQPLKNPSPGCWFSNKPIGYNKLDGTVARLCKLAGIPGYRTNHSLRATTATRLYQAGVDEQLVMERTGHQSLEGVRSYKRTSTAQQESISDILSGANDKAESTSTSLVPRAKATDIADSSCMVQVNNHNIANTTTNSLTNNVITPTPNFNFHSCSVTINYVNQPPL